MSQVYSKDLLKLTYHGIEAQIGLDETVTVNLRNLLKVHATLQELNQFFHQKDHYESLDDIKEYLGTYQSHGALRLINEARGPLLSMVFSDRVNKMFDDGAFEAPERPYYFEPRDKTEA